MVDSAVAIDRCVDLLLFVILFGHIYMAPYTKVEESFNIQATHDLLFKSDIGKFDHFQCPGVVPRTFAGPVALAGLSAIPSIIIRHFNVMKDCHQTLVRLILGSMNLLAFLGFSKTVSKEFGLRTSVWLRLIVGSQFHFIFYLSRTLPNTFAMFFVIIAFRRVLQQEFDSAFKWATAVIIMFRSELVILFGPLLFQYVYTGRIPVFARNSNFLLISVRRMIIGVINTTVLSLATTFFLDSLFWQRLTWPEGEVLLFNVVKNKSHEYGTSPFLWYFYAALPKALLFSLFLVPLGAYLERRVRPLLVSCMTFVFLYSILPHKELRFIMYVVPVFDLAAAVVCSRTIENRSKSWNHFLLATISFCHVFGNLIFTAYLLIVASFNYPGGELLNHVNHKLSGDASLPISVYIDNTCAQTGVTQFLQVYDNWTYNKTENMTIEDINKFDLLLLGSYGDELESTIDSGLYSSYDPIIYTEAFHKFEYKFIKTFPWIKFDIKYAKKTAALLKKGYRKKYVQ